MIFDGTQARRVSCGQKEVVLMNILMDGGMKELIHLPQECEGNADFNRRIVLTSHFQDVFGEVASLSIIARAMAMIRKLDKPDYLQVFSYNGIKFWAIADASKGDEFDDEDFEPAVTFLMPEDY